MLKALAEDIRSIRERDPAARSTLEVLLCYPGLHAVWAHRFTHWLWLRRFRLAARWGSQCTRFLTGIEIHPGAQLGPRLLIDHGHGVVIGETAQVGADVTLYHGVTLGGTSLSHGKRHPTLGDGVIVGAGAAVLGNITVGDRSRIGANAVVVRPVPPDAVVVGVPGQIVKRSKESVPPQPQPDQNAMPDAIGDTLVSLMQRVEALESHDSALHLNGSRPSVPQHGVWKGEDFTI
ncbi:MAG TPA: serine O-acetyltransferase [Abditibacteriaceae bacterium]|jgi:serine O-acetyltransferase